MPRDTVETAFLGIETSILGRRWVGPGVAEDRLAEALEQSGIAPAVARVLVRRGVEPAEAARFLAPTLRDLLPDPAALLDMERAAERLVAAVQRAERIAIFGDYDVDGAASSALLVLWLRALGREATLYIPDRIFEGYGPNAPAIAGLAAAHDLILCVDCGTLAHEALEAAAGTDVLVLDHHLGGETLPRALAVVNPNRQDETPGLGHLCAAGVVFLLLVAANRRLRAAALPEPALLPLLDLVALATVADVAPLVGVNRALVRQGLSIMARRERLGIAALADVARLDRAPTPHSLGWVFGPRVNAGGRIGRADLGARLLATADLAEAAAIAAELDRLNEERRAIEREVTEAALEQALARGAEGPIAWAAGEGWHPGVVGIAAARLKEATGRPAVVIGLEGGEGKGSGRSVAGVDLGAAVHRVAAEGLLLRGGGHAMAAGLTVARDGVEAAMARLGELLARQGAGEAGPRDLRLDGPLMPGAATAELVRALEAAGPFGAAAPAPRFAIPDVTLTLCREAGERHLKLCATGGGARLEVIAFGALEGPLSELVRHDGRRLHLAGRLELNHWQGRETVQLCLDDAAWA